MTIKQRIGRAFWRVGDALALGYDAGDSMRQRKDLGWGRSSPRDEDAMLGPDGSRETIRLKGTDLRRNNPVVAGACDRFASFAVGTGIIPQAKTKDDGWNKAAEEWWGGWSAVCDIRQRASLWALQWLAVSLRPTHGGMYLELLSNGQVRPIECERIRKPTDKDAGKLAPEGVRVDPGTGIVLGYWVHGRDEDGGFSRKHSEAFIPRENMVPVIRPPWRPDQVREVPDLAPMVPVLQDLHEMNLHTLNTAKVQSMIVGALKKQGGMGLNSMPRGSDVASPTVRERQTFRFDWGQVLEMFPNEDMDLKVSPTPGAQHIPYIKLQLMLAATALDVPYEFLTLDFSTADLSRQRAIMQLVNKTMRNWQRWLTESMLQRLWNWRIAKAIKAGDLAPAPTADVRGMNVSQWFRVEWQAPEEINTDRQEANQADMLEWQLGLGPLSGAAKRRGGDLEDRLRQKAADLKLAARIEQENGLPPGTLIKAQIPGQTDRPSQPNNGSANESTKEASPAE